VFYWRITKYNPLYRDENDHYLKDEWTSFSDIDDVNLTSEKYLFTENAYVNAVNCFISEMGITSLEVSDLEKYNLTDLDKKKLELFSEEMINVYNSIRNRDVINIKMVDNICKLALRETLWCKLKYEHGFVVHFGFDYYMYIGCSLKCEKAIEKVNKSGLFVEPCESPYQ
jgi:hypothetical protein